MASMLAVDEVMSRKDDDEISPYLRRPLRSHAQFLRERARRRGPRPETEAPPKEPRPAPDEGPSDRAGPDKKKKRKRP